VAHKDFDWFMDNMPDFYKKYGARFLVVKDKTVLGAYDTFREGVNAAKQKEPPGTFIVQQCFENREKAIRHIHGGAQVVRAW